MAKPRGPHVTRSPLSDHEHQSVSVRKIDNGYIASHSYDGRKGYESHDTFHAQKPVIVMKIGKAPAKPATPKGPMKAPSKSSGAPKDAKMGKYC
ncbi:MAG: hypothetical protein KGL39_48375 [Patescibacteria group bacterium]|nr:hypothetical protein [Patescibacteria group bacterium]